MRTWAAVAEVGAGKVVVAGAGVVVLGGAKLTLPTLRQVAASTTPVALRPAAVCSARTNDWVIGPKYPLCG